MVTGQNGQLVIQMGYHRVEEKQVQRGVERHCVCDETVKRREMSMQLSLKTHQLCSESQTACLRSTEPEIGNIFTQTIDQDP